MTNFKEVHGGTGCQGVVLIRSPSESRSRAPYQTSLNKKEIYRLTGKFRSNSFRYSWIQRLKQLCHLGSVCIWLSSAQRYSSYADKIATGNCRLTASQVNTVNENSTSLLQHAHINLREESDWSCFGHMPTTEPISTARGLDPLIGQPVSYADPCGRGRAVIDSPTRPTWPKGVPQRNPKVECGKACWADGTHFPDLLPKASLKSSI